MNLNASRNLNVGSGDWARAVRCMDRVLCLVPDNAESLRDRGLGYAELGHRAGAARDLGDYLQRWPDADDAETIRGRLLDLFAALPEAERAPVRERLLELFGLVGDTDARVIRARGRLSSLLF